MRISFLVPLLALIFTACGGQDTPYAYVNGKFSNEKSKKVYLYTVNNGEMIEYASTSVSADSSFAFALKPNDYGFYYVGTLKNNQRVWLSPGTSVELKINENKKQLIGQNSSENIVLQEWSDLTSEMKTKACTSLGLTSTYEDFYPLIDSLAPVCKAFINNISSGNSTFDKQMKFLATSDLNYYALQHLSSAHTKHPKMGNITTFHKELLKKIPFNDEDVRHLPYCWRYVSIYFSNKKYHVEKDKKTDFLDYVVKELGDNTGLIGDFLIRKIKNYRTHDATKRFLAKYGKYFTKKKQKNDVADYLAPMQELSKGQKAINFTYPDTKGKEVSLTDFKGKVVLVDVWATWCGPCKAELPDLQKLEHQYKGKDIVFLSLSRDKNKKVWLKYIDKHKLGGLHLFMGMGDEGKRLMTDYQIKGIPRFMLFDKKGNIVSVDAPRPSHGGLLSALIMTELKK